MVSLEVSSNPDFDDFRQDTERAFPAYVAAASRVIKAITPEILKRQAMVHPDGFLKVQIGPQHGVHDGQVRLHFWIPGRRSTEQPHSHPWHLASFVLAGTYREYQPVMRPTLRGLNEYRVKYPNGQDVRAGVERVGRQTFACDRGELHKTKTGDAHYLPTGPTHMSSPDGLGGITLAVMSPRFADEAHFFANDDTPYAERTTETDIAAVTDFINSVRGDF